MRRCTFFSRFCSRPPRTDDGLGEDGEANNEKRVRSPRDWSAIALAVLRSLQFLYVAFAYYSLQDFQRSSYFRDDGPWHHPPDQMRQSWRTLRWVRTQASVILVYHTFIIVIPGLLRLLKPTRRPFTGLSAVFGDGCAMVAMLNIMVQLDTAHEDYCHRPPPRADPITHAMFSFGRNDQHHHHNMDRHRAVCRSLDVVFGLGGIIIVSYLWSALVTAWRAKQSSPPSVHAKVEQVRDVEQGVTPRPAVVMPEAATRPQATSSQRQDSPPPPYRPAVAELAQEPDAGTGYPRGRVSMETVSSVGLDNYLVSDGWRAPEEPPVYSSRPPSLHHAHL
ncbi:uncharacterized protein B0T15DRAFT_539834 [Chaetomium strumarium]|uniref:Uncharacterized protein n=1 Tax=Chaetomium strumarium TaxID=1170767 RepID=A0AAJ0LZH6_9PEZI|nr:hypothetical protein B0T15DRAFT_539834 [Chaetomium strumarium]